MINHQRRRQCGAMAAIFVVNILHHLFAPLMLEIDVDVGRLVALFRDEALEQQRAAGRIDFGNAQAVTHRGIGGRAAPLAQNALAARKAHHVMHRQKIGFISQFRNQLQFSFQLLLHVGRNAEREARHRTFISQAPQIGRHGLIGRHDFFRVLVAQLFHGKRAAPRQHTSLRQGWRRIQLREAHALPQMLLGVWLQFKAAFRQRLAKPHRRHRILQRLARTHMHVHIATGHYRHAMPCRQGLQVL